MSARTISTIAIALLLSSGGLGLGLPDDDPVSGQEKILEPAPHAPWPTWGRDQNRSHHAGTPEVGIDPAALAERWRSAEPAEYWVPYSRIAVADLHPSPGLEVVTGRSQVQHLPDIDGPRGELELYTAGGELLWSAGVERGITMPVIADLDGDGEREIFISHGYDHSLFEADGSLAWRITFEKPVSRTISRPLALDVTGNGILDIVQYTLDAPPGSNPAERALHRATGDADERSVLFGLDGRTGEVLFRHPAPCGRMWNKPVATLLDGEPVVITGCRGDPEPEEGVIQALSFERRPPGDEIEEVEALIGAREPYETQVLWSEPLGDGSVRLDRLLIADVHASPGSELVGLWAGETLGMSVFSLDGEFIFEAEDPQDATWFGPTAAGDLDGDGLEDLVFVTAHKVQSYRMTNGGPEKVLSLPHEPIAGWVAGVTLADLDADGALEIIVGYQGHHEFDPWAGSVRVYEADGELSWRQDYPWPDEPVQEGGERWTPIRSCAVADIDQDGTFEILYPMYSRLIVYGGPP